MFFVILSSMFFVIACSSKSDDVVKNEIKVNGQVLTVEKISLTQKGIDNEITKYILLITEKGIEFDDKGDVSGGKGGVFYTDIYSKNTFGLNSGTYSTNKGKENDLDFSIEDAEYSFEWDMSKGDNVEFIEIEKGTIFITKNRDTYNIDFNLIDENDNVVTGSYNGSIDVKVD